MPFSLDGCDDELFPRAAEAVIAAQNASVSHLQRTLAIGSSRAGKLMEALEQAGIVGPQAGDEPRRVIPTPEDWREGFGSGTEAVEDPDPLLQAATLLTLAEYSDRD
jgi:hypothetical protein